MRIIIDTMMAYTHPVFAVVLHYRYRCEVSVQYVKK